MSKKMLTRQEAIEALWEFVDNPVISEELSDKLQEIANLIETEEDYGIDPFGMKQEDYSLLCVSPLMSINGVVQQSYLDHCEKVNKIIDKYSWINKFEKGD